MLTMTVLPTFFLKPMPHPNVGDNDNDDNYEHYLWYPQVIKMQLEMDLQKHTIPIKFKNSLRLWFEMCSMFVCFVCSKTWSFTTLLIGCWQKVTWNDGTDICSKHKRPQEKPVNLDKRYEINVTAVTNTNCAAETNTSVHSSESGCFVWPDPPCFKWNP